MKNPIILEGLGFSWRDHQNSVRGCMGSEVDWQGEWADYGYYTPYQMGPNVLICFKLKMNFIGIRIHFLINFYMREAVGKS